MVQTKENIAFMRNVLWFVQSSYSIYARMAVCIRPLTRSAEYCRLGFYPELPKVLYRGMYAKP